MRTSALIPGTFNPVHDGHLAIAHYCMMKWEIPIFCVAKTPFDKYNVPSAADRAKQFDAKYCKMISEPQSINGILLEQIARSFIQHKAIPKLTINIGIDTFVRVMDRKYYSSDEHYFEFAKNLKLTETIIRVFPRNNVMLGYVPNIFSSNVEFAYDFIQVNISSTELRNNAL